jgi:hypothetical protein
MSKTLRTPIPTGALPDSEEGKKAKKAKLVRDSFTIPKAEFAVIDQLKTRCIALGQPIKKSELLRAGIKLLAALSDGDLQAAVSQVPALKTGRPSKTEAMPEVQAPASAPTMTLPPLPVRTTRAKVKKTPHAPASAPAQTQHKRPMQDVHTPPSTPAAAPELKV